MTRELAGRAYNRAFDTQPGPALLAAIRQRPDIHSLQSRKPTRRKYHAQRFHRSGSNMMLPLAASIALMFGGFFSYQTMLKVSGPDAPLSALASLGTIPSDSRLSRLLEHEPSGNTLPVNGESIQAMEYIVVATFFDEAGRPCREFEIVDASDNHIPIVESIACRQPDASWFVEGVTHLAMSTTNDDSATFSPASGAKEATSLEDVMKKLGANKALSPAEEKQLVDAQWRKSDTN